MNPIAAARNLLTFLTLAIVAFAASHAEAQVSLCHRTTFELYNFTTSSSVFDVDSNAPLDVDWSGTIPAGDYSLKLEATAGVSNLPAGTDTGCFVDAVLEFDLDVTPTSIYSNRSKLITASAWGETSINQFESNNSLGTGNFNPMITTLDGFLANDAQLGRAVLRSESRYLGIVPNPSGARLEVEASGFAANALTGFPSPSGRGTATLNWRFTLPTAANWTLTADTFPSTTPGVTAYFPLLPGNVVDGGPVVEAILVDAPVQGWLAPPVDEGAIWVPEPPITAIAVEMPPADVERGAPYEVRVGSTSLGVFAAGAVLDLVALTGGGATDVTVVPTQPISADAPSVLPVFFEFDAAGADVTMSPVPAPEPRLVASLGCGAVLLAGFGRRSRMRASIARRCLSERDRAA